MSRPPAAHGNGRSTRSVREVDRRARQLLEVTLDGYILADDRGIIHDVNAAYCRMVGLPREALIGTDIRDREAALTPEQVDAKIRAMVAEGGARFTTRHRHADGHAVDLEVSISVLPTEDGAMVAAFVRDIGERLALEERLRRSAAHYRDLFDQAPVGLVELDLSEVRRRIEAWWNAGAPPHGDWATDSERCAEVLRAVRVIEVNRVARSMGALAAPWSEDQQVDPALARAFCSLVGQVHAGQVQATLEVEARDAGGDSRSLVLSLRPALGCRETWSRAFFSVGDVTGRRRMEAALRRAATLEAVGRMAGGLAHNINNALTIVSGYTSLALEALDPDHPASTDLREVLDATRAAAAVTRQLVALARGDPTPPEVIDLDAVIHRLTGALAKVVGEDIRIHCDLGGPFHVLASPTELEQALLNLVVNARQAMPEGGTVRLRTSPDSPPPHLARIARGRGPWVLLEVSDTGTGMAPEVAAHVFEPFFTTKPPGEGTGLGLATTHATVTRMGGCIDLESAPGQGTTFLIWLPLARPAQASHDPTGGEKRVPAARKRRGRILLVEDEPRVRSVEARVLRRAGHEVVCAGGRAEAEAWLARDGEGFDLLVTDVVLGDGNGIDLARSFRQRFGRPALLVSGYPRTSEEDGAELAGDLPWLVKPCAPAELEAQVAELLNSPGGKGQDGTGPG